MCGIPGVQGKPTAAQMGGFGAGGSGVTIESYTPNLGGFQSVYNNMSKTNPNALNLFGANDRGGTYTLSDGTTRNASEVIAENQTNAGFANPYNTHGLGRGQIANSYVGLELTAPRAQQDTGGGTTTDGGGQTQPATQNPAPAATSTRSGYTGAATTIIEEEEAPTEQNSSGSGESRRSRGRRRTRTTAQRRAASDTLVTGGAGVYGATTGSSKELLGA